MKTLEGCTFCMDHPDYNLVTKNIVPLERVVEETSNFRVIATLGQIPLKGGYVIICPREHHPCLGEMSEGTLKELDELKKDFEKRIVNSGYGTPVHFEHGVAGQTIFHAHLHSLPFPAETDMYDRIKARFAHVQEIGSLVDLKDIWKNKGVYAFYERNGRQYAFFTDLSPMYLRTDAAAEIGVPERGNWRNVPPEQDHVLIMDTVQKLGKK